MSGSEVKKCPKCGGKMESGKHLGSYGYITFKKKSDSWYRAGDQIVPFCCKNCGFIELYKV